MRRGVKSSGNRLSNLILAVAFGLFVVAVVAAFAFNNNSQITGNAVVDSIGLIASYSFDDNVMDSSLNGYHAENGSGVSYRSIDGRRAIYFRGDSTSFVRLNKEVFAGNPKFSISFWMLSGGNSDGIISVASSRKIKEFLVQNQQSLKISVRGYTKPIDSILNNNRWNHVVITVDSPARIMSVYVNGNLASTKRITSSTILSDYVVLGQMQSSLGKWTDLSRSYVGLIDELKIYNKVLNGLEVGTLYDVSPPVILDPSAVLIAPGRLTLSARTNESAVCRYSSGSDKSYEKMSSFLTTGGTLHSVQESAVTDTTFYIKCKDDSGNINQVPTTVNYRSGPYYSLNIEVTDYCGDSWDRNSWSYVYVSPPGKPCFDQYLYQGNCDYEFASGSSISLRSVPGSYNYCRLVSWGGDCSSLYTSSSGNITMDSNKNCLATFDTTGYY